MNTAKIDAQATAKLAELIKDIRIAMLTTVAPDGALRSRPMATQEESFDGDLWFFTSDDSPKTDEIAQEHQVNLSYADPKQNRYVSISGTGVITRNPVKARELWKPILKAWFPRGLEDPHLALLHVQVEHAEYWDAPSSKMVQLYGLAKAAISGTPPKNLGEHEKLNIRS
jgi:general stress protein 26